MLRERAVGAVRQVRVLRGCGVDRVGRVETVGREREVVRLVDLRRDRIQILLAPHRQRRVGAEQDDVLQVGVLGAVRGHERVDRADDTVRAIDGARVRVPCRIGVADVHIAVDRQDLAADARICSDLVEHGRGAEQRVRFRRAVQPDQPLAVDEEDRVDARIVRRRDRRQRARRGAAEARHGRARRQRRRRRHLHAQDVVVRAEGAVVAADADHGRS